jgi:hypothetical protein
MNERANNRPFNAQFFARSAEGRNDEKTKKDEFVIFVQARADENRTSPFRGVLFRHEQGAFA